MTGERERLGRRLEAGVGWVHGLAWSPDGARLAVGGDRGVAVLTAEGRELWRDDGVGECVGVGWSPDGRRVAGGGDGRVLHVWEAATGEESFASGHQPDWIWTVAWSPDGRRTACAASGAGVVVFDVAGGRRLLVAEHPRAVLGVDWSPSGTRFASACTDGRIRVWDAARGAELAGTAPHGGEAWRVSWSPDGRHIVAGHDDSRVRVWSAELTELLVTAEGHTARVDGVQWSPDGGVFASASDDHTARVWDGRDGDCLAVLPGRSGWVLSVAFSSDGTRLATASEDGTVGIWDIADLAAPRARSPAAADPLAAYVARQAETVGRGEAGPAPAGPAWLPRLEGANGLCLGMLKAEDSEYPGSVALSPDGLSLFASGSDGSLRRWDLRTGREAWAVAGAHSGWVSDVSLSSDGSRLAAASVVGHVSVRDGDSGAVIWQADEPGIAGRVRWSPDGTRLASRHSERVIVWDARRGSPLWTSDNRASAPTWSPDGRQLAVGTWAGTVQVLDAGDGAVQLRLEVHSDNWVTVASWGRTSDRIATGGGDRSIRIWEAHTGRQFLEAKGHENVAHDLRWSPDETRLASASEDSTVRIWDAATGVELARYDAPEDVAWRVAWSPDGAFLASSHSGNVFRLWDARHTMPRTVAARPLPPGPPLSPALAALPATLAALHRRRRAAPLSLLRDLLLLLTAPGRLPDGPAARLASHPGTRALAALRWPTPARVALVLLLLRHFDDPGFAPPLNTTPAELRWRLLCALDAPEVPPTPAPAPLGPIERALTEVDDRLLTLLAGLGPDACAADPTLPLTLLPRLADLTPLASPQRRLLSLRVPTIRAGEASGAGVGSARSGFSSRGDLLRLVPSQWALPEPVRAWRHANGGLLYRARTGEEPPRLRPTVLVLDVSPPCFGPIERVTRPAAHALAATLLDAGQPAWLLAAGGANTLRPLQHPADLFELLASRTLRPLDTATTLRQARTLQESLRDVSPLDPVIVLLTHPWSARRIGTSLPRPACGRCPSSPLASRPARPGTTAAAAGRRSPRRPRRSSLPRWSGCLGRAGSPGDQPLVARSTWSSCPWRFASSRTSRIRSSDPDTSAAWILMARLCTCASPGWGRGWPADWLKRLSSLFPGYISAAAWTSLATPSSTIPRSSAFQTCHQ